MGKVTLTLEGFVDDVEEARQALELVQSCLTKQPQLRNMKIEMVFDETSFQAKGEELLARLGIRTHSLRTKEELATARSFSGVLMAKNEVTK